MKMVLNRFRDLPELGFFCNFAMLYNDTEQ